MLVLLITSYSKILYLFPFFKKTYKTVIIYKIDTIYKSG